MDKVELYTEKAIELLMSWGPKLVLAIVILVAGIIIINSFSRFLRKFMKKRDVDPTLIPFLVGLISTILKVMLIISVVDIVGVKTTSFVAMLGAADERILPDPAPFIGVTELGDSSVNLVVRIWCKKEDYWNIHFDWQNNVKLRFDKENITIPYPHRTVYTIAETAG
jgi:small-conductance mechanosensitive channel